MASLSIPNTFTNNTVADAVQVNQNFNTISSHVNSNLVNIDGSVKAGTSAIENLAITEAKIANGAITVPKLSPATLEYLVPVGSIVSYIGTSAPNGWLICDGSTFDAITYPTLNSLLGGNTLPNLQLRIPMGAGSGVSIKSAGGNRKIGTTNLPAHSHGAGTLSASGYEGAHQHGFTTDTGGAHAHSLDGRQGPTASHGHDGADKFAMAPSNRTSTDYSQNSSMHAGHSHTGITYSNQGGHNHSISGSTANTGDGADYFQPYYAVNYIIKAI